jgi:hypothetical protein
MLLRGIRVFLAFGVIALPMMFSGGAMGFRSIFMVFGSLVVFVSCHCEPRFGCLPELVKPCLCKLFREDVCSSKNSSDR